MEQLFTEIKPICVRHPKAPGMRYTYGTAGFRARAEILDCAMFRVGLIAALRSHCLKSRHNSVGYAVGAMITASHNLVHDNGAKVSDASGEMMAPQWEKYATQLANAESETELFDILRDICAKEDVDPARGHEAVVLLAMDTRPSSPVLREAIAQGIAAMRGRVIDCGELTTPQLHYMVRWVNFNNGPLVGPKDLKLPTSATYYEQLASAYASVILDSTVPSASSSSSSSSAFSLLGRSELIVDAADGIGGPRGKELAPYLAAHGLPMSFINDGTHGTDLLNIQSGAEYVQKERLIPRNVAASDSSMWGRRIACLDGDADRLVYFYLHPADGRLCLLDGDKIAALSAMFIHELLDASLLAADESPSSHSLTTALDVLKSLHVGVVQTAYANGSSTAFLRDTLKLEVPMVPTGVKHLHHRAVEFDIGIYFEANGHGTVVFSQNAIKAITHAYTVGQSTLHKESAGLQALRRLFSMTELINQAVGDALSDMLMVEAILQVKNWTFAEWDALYADLPSRQTKVVVKDRTKIKTTFDETSVVTPKALQDSIDAIVSSKYAASNGRAFVRPSGTEDIVRIYAEAATQAEADQLAAEVGVAVYDLCDGVPPRPVM